MKRRFLALLALGITIGTILAVARDWPIVFGYGYIRHHMYNTAARIILASFNGRVLMCTIVCLSIWLAFAVMERLHGRARSIYKAVMTLTAVMLLSAESGLYSHIRSMASEFDSSVLSLLVSTGLTQIVLSIVLLAIGVFVMARLKRNRSENDSGSLNEGFRLLWEYLNRFGRLIEKQTALIIIPLAGFFLVNVTVLGFALSLKSSNMRFAENNPNIIFIMVDTLRADHVGCYGYSRNTTPNIDKLAGEGIRFSKAISQAPWTTASVASFMSGRYLRIESPITLSEVTPPPFNVPFLQDILKDRGYTTAAVVSNPYVGEHIGMSSGYDYFEGVYDGSVSSPDVEASASRLVEKIKDKRFFMFLLFLDPHSPYVLHDKYDYYPHYKGKLGAELRVGAIDAKSSNWSSNDLEYAKSLYDSEIAYTDEHIGKFLNELKRMKLYNDTLIVFIADHGDAFNEHGEMSHGTNLYDELLSVPLIIKLPGQRTGSVAHGTFSLLNLLPSILDYLHYDTSHLGLQGKTARLKGLKTVEPSVIYSSTKASSMIGMKNLECLRVGDLKYIFDMNSQCGELYDVRKDPKEQHNIAAQHKSTIVGFHKMLQLRDNDIDKALQIPGEQNDHWKAADEDSRRSAIVDEMHRTDGKFTNKEEHRLRSLGYLQ